MKANVINLIDRTDRWEAINGRWINAPFDLERVDAFRMENVYHAVFLKHRELLHQAKAKGETHLLVMEDDAVPCRDYELRWKHIKEVLDQTDDWDVFNGGMLSIRNCIQNVFPIKKEGIRTLLVSANRGCMAHFLYFHVERTLEKIKDWEIDGKPEFDAWYPHKLKCVACIPFLAIQDDGYSNATNETREWRDRFIYEEESHLFTFRHLLTSSWTQSSS